MTHDPKGKLFSDEYLQSLRKKFHHVESDHHGRKRLFFDNSGGSFRLKKAQESLSKLDAYPDCPERSHDIADELNGVIKEAQACIQTMVGAKTGSSFIRYTASLCNFELIEIACKYLEGTNLVTTILEHPSSYDACERFGKEHGKEIRVAGVNPATGRVSEKEILDLVDEDTAFVNLIAASNITGAILDLKTLLPKLREKKPGLYVLCDTVQHAPHHTIDVEALGIDACSIALYKMFGPRGIGIGYVSERFSKLPHKALSGKEPSHWDLGSPSPGFYKAIIEVVRYVESIGREHPELEAQNDYERGMNAIHLHEKALLHFLVEGDQDQVGLKSMEGVHLHFIEDGIDHRDLIIGLTIGDEDPTVSTKRYAEKNVTVYERVSSSLYSKRMIDALQVKGVIRVSPIHLHSLDDMRTFLTITQELATRKEATYELLV